MMEKDLSVSRFGMAVHNYLQKTPSAPLQGITPPLRNRLLRLSQSLSSISDSISHLKKCPDKQEKERKDQTASIRNLHKNEGIHGNMYLSDIFIDENGAATLEDVGAMRFGQYCVAASKCLWMPPEQFIVGDDGDVYSVAHIISQQWTLHRSFSRNPTPEDHADKPSHLDNLRNVFFRRLEAKSSAVTFGNPTSTRRSNDTFEDKRSICPRYRFKQSHLRFLGTFADVRDQPGWILPTAAKILVDVTQTEDTDAWSGQVEGSDERGMFLYTAVEPV
jgi:hypothetical protein